MVVAKIKVDGVCAVAEYRKLIPAGIIGAQVLLDYADGVWQGLHKTVVFRGAATKDVITDADVVTIPAEVVAKHGVALQVGVYGVDADGNIAIPTLWADLRTIRDAADPSGDATTDPSLPVWEQVRHMITTLSEVADDAGAAAGEARDAAGEANQLVEDIQQMLENGDLKGDRGDAYFTTFSVNEEDGHLYMSGSENVEGVTFAINESGNLEVSYG